MATKKAAKKTGARGTAAKQVARRASGRATAKSAKKAATKQPVARKAVKKTAAKKPVPRKAATKQSVAKKPAVRKAATKRSAAKKPVARKVAKTAKTASATKATRKTTTRARPSTPKGPAPQRSTREASNKRSDGISREQALANTRELLAAKQQREQESPPWQTFDQGDGAAPQSGFQSDEARVKADQLHEDEMRLQGNQGSISSSGRRRQGKRDSREGT